MIRLDAHAKAKRKSTVFHNEKEHDFDLAPEYQSDLRELWTKFPLKVNTDELEAELRALGVQYVSSGELFPSD